MSRSKKPAILLTVLALVISTAGFAAAAPPDVIGLPCEQAVVYLMDLGIVAGYPDGTIMPGGAITRAEAVKVIIVVKYGSEELAKALAGQEPFDDVAGGHWASGHIALAKSDGIVEGHGDGSFGPDDHVTYTQFAKMLVEAAGLTGDPLLAWPDNYVTVAGVAGIVADVPSFAAGSNAPRGDCFVMAAATVRSVPHPETGKTLAESVFGEVASAPVLNETQQTEHPTLSAAVGAAAAGDVIVIPAGTYRGSVIIPETLAGLTLQGAGKEETIVGGDLTITGAAGVALEGFTVSGNVKVHIETMVNDLYIIGDLDAAPAGGSRIADTSVDGDVYLMGTEFVVERMVIGGDAYVGGPHIELDQVAFGGQVYGAALYDLQVLKAAGEVLLASSPEAQDLYIGFTVAGTSGDYDAKLEAGRQVTLAVSGLGLDLGAAWTVSHPQVLDLAVEVIDDYRSVVTLTVKEGQTLAAGSVVVVSAPDGVQRTADWGQILAERDKTMPWAQFEFRLLAEYHLDGGADPTP